MIETLLLPAVVLVPLALGAVSFILGERAARVAALPGWIAVTVLTVEVATRATDAPLGYALGAWGAPLGIELVADPLSVVFLGLAAVVYGGVLPFAAAYFPRGSREMALFWPLAWLLWGALNAIFLAADLFNLYVALELMGLCAVGLAALSGKTAALAASLRYLLAALVGSNFFLLAVALLYGATGALALRALAEALAPSPAFVLAGALVLVALALKTALAPLHAWLPPAHGGAATPVSALLSALVIKGSFFILLRLWLLAAAPLDLAAAGRLLGALGAAAILWGSVAALVQTRVKMVVAYSTVAQVGYLFVPFALLAPGAPAATLAIEGGVLHAAAHGVAKSAMFLAAGTLVLCAGRDDLAALRGAAGRAPAAAFAFGLAGASLIGVPPTAGFAAKWQLLRAALEADEWGWAAVLIAGGLLAAAYVFRVLRLVFLPAPDRDEGRAMPAAMSFWALALALAAAGGGLLSAALLDALGLGSVLPEGWRG